MRRIEALTGPEAIARLRRHDALLADAAAALRTQPEGVPDAVADVLAERKKLEKAAKTGSTAASFDANALLQTRADGRRRHRAGRGGPGAGHGDAARPPDRVKDQLGDAAIVLGARDDGKRQFVASVAPALSSAA